MPSLGTSTIAWQADSTFDVMIAAPDCLLETAMDVAAKPSMNCAENCQFVSESQVDDFTSLSVTTLLRSTNIGKTKITAKFRRSHPNKFDDRTGVERCSVVSMQMPPTPDQHRFYSGLLFELGAPHNAAAGLASLERLARDILRRVSPRMLVVDEIHHLLAGSYREQRASLNLLKFLANDLQISMVLVGTRDAVLALQTDAQMIGRYTPFEIPRWRESDGLRRLLAAFERVLPLRKPSDLARREIVQFVLSASGGLTGDISALLNNAVELAIRNGDELIDMTHLEHVCRITQ
ncbi:TniB family NTP-binding protein [Paraburkholderia dilworthii]|uniref:TniB family NTP-binding protein n=1 Tax=Paraburkholderia dilworthii TaxID=948106 RepID=UPI001FCAA35A|nr:TniB family NTP-binding protein [Paraburkholderia dilworthii]